MKGGGSNGLRQTPTEDLWRALAARVTQRIVTEVEHRRAEDRIREELHDARAKTIYAHAPVEQRERRAGAEARNRREQQRREWDRRGAPAPPKRMSRTGKRR